MNKESNNSFLRVSADNTHPVYWLAFAVAYIAVASCVAYFFFNGDSELYKRFGYVCVGLFPAGIIVNKLLKKLGCWHNRKGMGVRLGDLLYAPALVLPMAIVGYPIYHFTQYPVLVCFALTTGVVVTIVLLVDTCLNLLRNQFVWLFQTMYKCLYKLVVDFLIKTVLVELLWVRIIAPVLERLYYVYVKMASFFWRVVWRVVVPACETVWNACKSVARFLVDNVLVPLCRLIKEIVCFFYDNVLCPIGRLIKEIVCFFYDNVLCPIGRSIRAVAIFVADLVKCFSRFAVRCADFVMTRVIAPAVLLAIHVCKWTWSDVLAPFFRFCQRVLVAVYDNLVLGFCRLAKKMVKFFVLNVVEPVCRAIGDLVIFSLNEVLVPMCRFFANLCSKVLVFMVNKIFVPFVDAMLKVFEVIGECLKYVASAFGKCIKWLVRKFYKYVLVPIGKLIRWVAELIYNYFLKYVFHIIAMQYFFFSKQMKIVFSWVFSDANGVINYFVTIPLLILAVVGAGVYFFLIV